MSKWYEEAVFYHMYPLGMTGAPRENTPQGAANRFEELDKWIPHMKSLGCNALYIGPLFQSSSHGYDTMDYRLVDSRLGSNEDFISFVKQCHDSGIKVVVDGVFNHTGRQFFAFEDIREKKWDSPYKDWYKGVSFDWNSPMDDGFGYEAWQGHFELPCLNLYNPQVKDYLFDVIRFWVDTFDIDGIRLDCANILDFDFMKEMRHQTNSMKEDFWLMGEVIHGEYTRWVNDETLYSVTNYELHKSLYSGLNDHNFFEIAHNVRRLEAICGRLYTFLDNHDENRIASKLTNPAHLPLAYLLLFTLPGIPSVYYGGEWGVAGLRTDHSDDALRPCIPIAEADERNCPLTDWITQLIHIHTKWDAFYNGCYEELLLTNRQYAFARHGQASTIITALNCDDTESQIALPAPADNPYATNLLDGETVPVENGKINLTLPPNSGVVLKIGED